MATVEPRHVNESGTPARPRSIVSYVTGAAGAPVNEHANTPAASRMKAMDPKSLEMQVGGM
jgi:hypothetical protein